MKSCFDKERTEGDVVFKCQPQLWRTHLLVQAFIRQLWCFLSRAPFRSLAVTADSSKIATYLVLILAGGRFGTLDSRGAHI